MADLTVVLQAEMQRDQLVMRYTVRNGLGQDVYVLNRLFTSVPPRMSPDIAYVELDGANQVVRVFKGLAPMPSAGSSEPNAPRRSGPTEPVAPYVTPVRAGATYSEIVRQEAPVRVYREYGHSPPRLMPPEERIAQFRGVSFALGWYARAPGVTEAPVEAFGQKLILPAGFRGMPEIHTTRSNVVEMSIPVIVLPS